MFARTDVGPDEFAPFYEALNEVKRCDNLKLRLFHTVTEQLQFQL